MFNLNIEHLKKILKNFDRFIYFSFPSITTYLNKKNIEKKKANFENIKWKNISEKNVDYSHEAFAIICGKISNLTVIDIDDINVYKQLLKKYPIIENVFKIETRNGIHLYFNYDENIKTTTNAFISYSNVDIRNDDSIIFIPPTKYKMLNGDTYEYVFIGGDMMDVPTDLLTEFKQFHNEKGLNIIKKEKNVNKFIGVKNNAENTNKINEIKNLIYQLPKNYCDDYDEWIKIGFIVKNELGIDGFDLFDNWSKQSLKYNEEDIKKKYNSFEHKSDGLTIATLYKILNNGKYKIITNFTTGDNADYFKKIYGDKFIYYGNTLYYFNGVYFKADNNNFSYLNNFINDIYFYNIFNLFQQYEVIEIKKNDGINKNEIYTKIENIKKNILQLKNHRLRKNYICDIICKITNNDIKWNQKTNLFAFENKIYDINLKQFVEPLPEFFINISCGWKYDDNYDINLINELDKFIDTIHPNKEIKVLYLTVLSTGLSGQTLEKFIVANGAGGNGKGVFNELALDTFGNYGYVLPSNVIMQPLKLGSNPEIANCNFKRFVVIREPDDNYKIYCSTIKEMTGGKDINARLNHSNDTNINLNMTLVMECNNKPKLSEVGNGMKRRLVDIPFDSSFIDKCFYDKLDDEFKTNTFTLNKFYKTNEFREKYKQALFILLTEYYHEYNKNGSLIIPEIIEKRTMEYMSNSDEIFCIVDEILEKTNDKKDFIKIKDLFELAKGIDYYVNMTKEQKRNFNYKNFCLKLENNLFLKYYICLNSDKIKIIRNHKIKNNVNI